MLAAAKRKVGRPSMPVQELPMPPVKLQRQDSSGGVVMHTQKSNEKVLVPQLSKVKLKFAAV